MMKETIAQIRQYDNILKFRNVKLIEKSAYELGYFCNNVIIESFTANLVKKMIYYFRGTFNNNKQEGKKNILFFVYTNSHISTILPFFKEIENDALIVKRDGFRDSIKKRLNLSNLKFEDIEKYFYMKNNENKKDIKEMEGMLAKIHNVIKENNMHNKLLNKSYHKDLRYLFRIYFPEMIRYIIAIENMLDHEKPNLLVVMNETTMLGGVAVALAKSKGIRTICIQHGAMGDDAADILPVTVDKILVWGNSTKKILVDSHVPEEKIMITGPPQIDRKIIISDEEKKSIERIGVNRNKRIVFLTTQPIPEMNDIVIEVCKAVKGIENTQLVIKMHPAEFSPDMYKKIAKEVGIDAIITKDYLYPLIDACEVMVTSSSTVGIESLMLGKPVMTINLSVLPDIIPYARHKVAIGAYSKEDIKPKLELILKNKTVRDELMGHAQEFIHEFCYKMDGRSSERIIAVIKEMNQL